ncbi:hypothetical protein V6Z11_D11G178700 [Gossypium hirsutum]
MSRPPFPLCHLKICAVAPLPLCCFRLQRSKETLRRLSQRFDSPLYTTENPCFSFAPYLLCSWLICCRWILEEACACVRGLNMGEDSCRDVGSYCDAKNMRGTKAICCLELGFAHLGHIGPNVLGFSPNFILTV